MKFINILGFILTALIIVATIEFSLIHSISKSVSINEEGLSMNQADYHISMTGFSKFDEQPLLINK